MRISLSAVFIVIFLIMLAALGHGPWKVFEIQVLNIIVSLLTGGKATA